MTRTHNAITVVVTAAPGLLVPEPVAAQPATARISVSSGGVQGNRPSGRPAIGPGVYTRRGD